MCVCVDLIVFQTDWVEAMGGGHPGYMWVFLCCSGCLLASPSLLQPAHQLLPAGLEPVLLLLEPHLLCLQWAHILGGLLQDQHLGRLLVVCQLWHVVAQCQEAGAQVVAPLALQDVVVTPALAVLRVRAAARAAVSAGAALAARPWSAGERAAGRGGRGGGWRDGSGGRSWGVWCLLLLWRWGGVVVWSVRWGGCVVVLLLVDRASLQDQLLRSSADEPAHHAGPWDSCVLTLGMHRDGDSARCHGRCLVDCGTPLLYCNHIDLLLILLILFLLLLIIFFFFLFFFIIIVVFLFWEKKTECEWLYRSDTPSIPTMSSMCTSRWQVCIWVRIYVCVYMWVSSRESVCGSESVAQRCLHKQKPLNA